MSEKPEILEKVEKSDDSIHTNVSDGHDDVVGWVYARKDMLYGRTTAVLAQSPYGFTVGTCEDLDGYQLIVTIHEGDQ